MIDFNNIMSKINTRVIVEKEKNDKLKEKLQKLRYSKYDELKNIKYNWVLEENIEEILISYGLVVDENTIYIPKYGFNNKLKFRKAEEYLFNTIFNIDDIIFKDYNYEDKDELYVFTEYMPLSFYGFNLRKDAKHNPIVIEKLTYIIQKELYSFISKKLNLTVYVDDYIKDSRGYSLYFKRGN